jgi:deazaflavin-dependent oxidoreductase (nitroreductase family)
MPVEEGRMSSMAKTIMATGNKLASWLYERSNGSIGGSARGVPVLLVTVPGRKSGTPRTVPLAYFEHDGGYLVAATAGGSKHDPEWIRNLDASDWAEVRVGEQQFDVDVRVIRGEERDRLWADVIVSRAPSFARYEEKSGRSIPLALLTRRP